MASNMLTHFVFSAFVSLQMIALFWYELFGCEDESFYANILVSCRHSPFQPTQQLGKPENAQLLLVFIKLKTEENWSNPVNLYFSVPFEAIPLITNISSSLFDSFFVQFDGQTIGCWVISLLCSTLVDGQTLC
jgi:hypothetical protein